LGDVISAMIPPAQTPPTRERLEIVEDVESAFYLHMEVADRPGVLAQVAQVLGLQGVSIKSVVQKGLGENARLVMVAHPILESRFFAALEMIAGLDFMRSRPRAIRVIEAAYAARAGLRGAVIVPEGKIAAGKLAQALMHGARVVALRGNFDQALKLVRELVERHPIALVNSVNEFRLAGQKTAAFEIAERVDIDALYIPVGNAGNVTAYWRGFRELELAPRLLGLQAEGAAP